MYMKNWIEKLDAFLQFNEEAILQDKGKISHEIAKTLAEKESYSHFQRFYHETAFSKCKILTRVYGIQFQSRTFSFRANKVTHRFLERFPK